MGATIHTRSQLFIFRHLWKDRSIPIYSFQNENRPSEFIGLADVINDGVLLLTNPKSSTLLHVTFSNGRTSRVGIVNTSKTSLSTLVSFWTLG